MVHIQPEHVGKDLHCEHEHGFKGSLSILRLVELLEQVLVVTLSLLGEFSNHILDLFYSLVRARLLVTFCAEVIGHLDWLVLLALVQKLLLQVRSSHYLSVVAVIPCRLLVLIANLEPVVNLGHQPARKLAPSWFDCQLARSWPITEGVLLLREACRRFKALFFLLLLLADFG